MMQGVGVQTAVVAVLAALIGHGVVRSQPEFRINSYTTADQVRPDIAALSNGFVVVWSSDGPASSDPSQNGIRAIRLDSTGSAIGGEFQVSSFTTYQQNRPVVAVGLEGQFVVVWSSDFSDDSGYGIQMRRFTSSGAPLGQDLEVNTYTTRDQFNPAAAIAPSGDIVVAWNSRESSGDEPDSGQPLYERPPALPLH